jgi:hypothetical protein
MTFRDASIKMLPDRGEINAIEVDATRFSETYEG